MLKLTVASSRKRLWQRTRRGKRDNDGTGDNPNNRTGEEWDGNGWGVVPGIMAFAFFNFFIQPILLNWRIRVTGFFIGRFLGRGVFCI